jgi:hypothetical protein
MDKKIISSVKINQSNMSAAAQSRSLAVSGDIGSEFILNVIKINGTSKESYYNFKTKVFTEAFISENNLYVKMNSSKFSTNINFPADATGDVYSILLMASEEKSTELSDGSKVITKNITQVGQTTVYIEADEGVGKSSYYTANPPDSAITSVGSTVQTSGVNIPIAWTLTNAASDTYGFGLMLQDRPASNQLIIPDTYWYVEQAQVVDGSVSSSTTVTFDDVTNLRTGMTLAQVSSGSLAGTPLITAIDSKTVTLSSSQSFADGITLTFRAYGPNVIKKVSGLNVSFNSFLAKGTQLTKTVRTAVTLPQSDSSVTYALNGTYGVAGGGLVRITGFNVNENGNNNLIQTVTASSTAGSVAINYVGTAADVVRVETIPVGIVLYIVGSHQEIKIEGTVSINKYPDSNWKLYLDLNKFITVGSADE